MPSKLLKKDLFGEIRLDDSRGRPVVVRDCRGAATGLRWLARRLLAREARALTRLAGIPGVPVLVSADAHQLVRSYLAGEPLYRARARGPEYYAALFGLVRRLHAAGVVHNDLAKEANILVDPDGLPAVIDFQVASCPQRRNLLHRILGREDLRHVLKHKRTYCAGDLTRRERVILATPSLPARIVRRTIKPFYLFVTRRVLGWADREGAERTRA